MPVFVFGVDPHGHIANRPKIVFKILNFIRRDRVALHYFPESWSDFFGPLFNQLQQLMRSAISEHVGFIPMWSDLGVLVESAFVVTCLLYTFPSPRDS